MDTRRLVPNDLEADERRALEALGLQPEAMGPQDDCPDPALLLASREGVLADDVRHAVDTHVAACPLCQRLGAALGSTYDEAADAASRGLTPPVRVPAAPRPAVGWRWLVPAGGLALASSLGWWLVTANVDVGPPPEPPGLVAELARPVPFRVSVLQANRPDIPAGDIELVFRGEAAPAVSAADQALDALDLAQRDGRDAAIRQLEGVSAQNPEAPEPALALGALLLDAGSAARALTVLDAARSRATGGLRDEIDWYLAVAHARMGRADRAAAVLAPLCEGAGPRSALACAGLDELASSRVTR